MRPTANKRSADNFFFAVYNRTKPQINIFPRFFGKIANRCWNGISKKPLTISIFTIFRGFFHLQFFGISRKKGLWRKNRQFANKEDRLRLYYTEILKTVHRTTRYSKFLYVLLGQSTLWSWRQTHHQATFLTRPSAIFYNTHCSLPLPSPLCVSPCIMSSRPPRYSDQIGTQGVLQSKEYIPTAWCSIVEVHSPKSVVQSP